jgi:hypothetical protein
MSAVRIWSARAFRKCDSPPAHARRPKPTDSRNRARLGIPIPIPRSHAASSTIAARACEATHADAASVAVNPCASHIAASNAAYTQDPPDCTSP